VTQLLSYQPTQKNIAIAQPTAAEQESCTVDVQNLGKGPGRVWILKDGKGTILRRIADTNGDKYPDQWSYFRDGQEVYREVDSKLRGKPDRFFWLNANGMKIGADRDGNGTIDQWLAISMEELTQEVVQALAEKDFKRFEALLLTEEELAMLGAPATEVTRIKELQKHAASRFQQSAAKLGHYNAKTRWLHVESGSPSRLLAETTGMKQDVLMYYRVLILTETEGKNDFVQLGEIVRVGDCWKLLDAPAAGDAVPPATILAGNANGDGGRSATTSDPLLKELADLDSQAPHSSGGVNPAVVNYHLQRINVLDKIYKKAPNAEKLTWFKQMVDSYSAAAQASPANNNQPLAQLEAFAQQMAQAQPTGEATAYVVYRAITAGYSAKVGQLTKAEEMQALQAKYQEKLMAFVAAHPTADDAADALLQLGMIHEFQNKEAEAEKAYRQLVTNFPNARQAAKAQGAIRRLTIAGNTWELTGNVAPLGNGPAFNPAALRGKTVVVYYWASWCQSAAADFAKLAELAKGNPSRPMEVIAINLDDNAADAEAFLRRNQPIGFHLRVEGGLESPTIQHYGLTVFPTLFVIGPNGKVAGRCLEVGSIETVLNPPAK
jgi:thiol-disulfide isomerase/thioredoxin